jgi:hypothetical protein
LTDHLVKQTRKFGEVYRNTAVYNALLGRRQAWLLNPVFIADVASFGLQKTELTLILNGLIALRLFLEARPEFEAILLQPHVRVEQS